MISLVGLQASDRSAPRGGVVGCESVQQIVNIAATAEALAVTALGGALQSAASGRLQLNAEQQQFVRAARAEEEQHFRVLLSMGAHPLTTTFTLPDTRIVTDAPTFLRTVIGLEEAFIAAYLAAAQEFAALGQPHLVQAAMQIGGVEAEHRAHARFYAIGAGVLDGVPNNLAFEQAMFTRVGDAATALQRLGWIGGRGQTITYPGPSRIDTTGVGQLRP